MFLDFYSNSVSATRKEEVAGIRAKFPTKVPVSCLNYFLLQMSPVKRICVFEHSVMTNFNCACPAIQSGQGSGFLSEGSS